MPLDQAANWQCTRSNKFQISLASPRLGGCSGESRFIGSLWGGREALYLVLRQVAPAMAGDDYARQGSAWAPADDVWSYEAEGFASFFASGLQRLRSGNTWVTEAATGRMFEITPAGDVVWEYVNPVTINGILADGEVPAPQANALFKTVKLRPGHPALVDRDLVSQGPLTE